MTFWFVVKINFENFETTCQYDSMGNTLYITKDGGKDKQLRA